MRRRLGGESPTMMAKHFGLLLACTVLSVRSNILETVEFAQQSVSKEALLRCSDDETSLNMAYEGGSDYLNHHFSQLKDQVAAHGAKLRRLTVIKSRVDPYADLISDIHAKLVSNNTYNHVKSVEILLGMNTELLLCYENGFYATCTDKQRAIYNSAAVKSWTHSYTCKGWTASFVDTVVRIRPDSSTTKAVISVELNLQSIDVNQCPNSTDVGFARTARCRPDVSVCKHVAGSGFVVGSYLCQCLHCSECADVKGKELMAALDAYNVTSIAKNAEKLLRSRCAVPKKKQLLVVPEIDIKGQEVYALLILQGVSVLVCLVFAVLVLIFHYTQVVQSANPCLLLMILLGGILKYAMTAVRALSPSELICSILPWLEELSFTLMFGFMIVKASINLEIYPLTTSRGSRFPMSKYWAIFLFLAVLYLSSWTAITFSYSTVYNASIVILETSAAVNDAGDATEQLHIRCLVTGWNYVTQLGELVIVAYGLYIAFRLRHAKTAYSESIWYTVALVIELIGAFVYYLLSYMFGTSGYLAFVMACVYTHVTVTPVILLLFTPKFYYIQRDGGSSQLSNGKPGATGEGDLREMSISRMNPEELKSELKRVYEELHMTKSTDQPCLAMEGESSELEPLNPVTTSAEDKGERLESSQESIVNCGKTLQI